MSETTERGETLVRRGLQGGPRLVGERWRRLPGSARTLLVAVAVFGCIGLGSQLISHAVTPTGSFELENGTAIGNGAAVADASASGGSAFRFGSGSNPITKTYTASTAILPNPEQGFYYYTETHYQSDNSGYSPLSTVDLQAKRSGGFTQNGLTFGPTPLVHRYFYLEKYQNGSAIDSTYLSLVDADLAAVRAAHDKIILRFAYTSNFTGGKPYGDAPSPSAVQSQIAALAPTLNKYADVITGVEAGFIGVWGEWYYTDNFTTGTDMGTLTSTDWTNRTNVVNALVTQLDPRIFVLVRYVGIKQHIYGLTPSDPNANRVGFHNDAFEASTDDYGTYSTFTTQSVSQNQAYLAAQPPLPQSGESASYNPPQSDWAQASADLAKYHWSSMNPNYFPQTLQAWEQANVNTVSQKLGYRLELQSATVSGSGSSRSLSVTLKNTGYAPPFRNRPVTIVLSNGTNSYTTTVSGQDIRSWTPGNTTTFSTPLTAPAVAGTYSVYLVLPDPSASLASTLDYSIQMANTGVWNASRGNDLGFSLTY